MTYNTKGIFTQRRNSAGGFEEYPFNVTNNSVVVINSTGDLNCIANSDFIDSLPPVTSASYSLSSSYVPNLYPVNLNGYELTSSFNSYTSSNDNRVNNLTLNTSSYVNSSQTSSMLVGSSSIAFTASYITSSNISGIVNSSSYALTSSYLTGYSIPTLVTSSISSSYSNISHTSNTSSYLTLNNNNILVDDGLGNMVVTTTNNTIFTNTSQFGGNQVTQSSFFDNNGNLYITDPILGVTTYIYTSGEIDCARGQASIDANGNFFGNHIFLTSKLPKGNGTIAIGDLDPNNGDWGIWTDASGTMDVYRQYNLYNPSNSGSRLQLDQNGNMWLKGTLTASFFHGSSSYSITSSYVPNLYPVNLNGYVSTSSFNSYTSSNDSRVNSLISSTSSYLLSSQTSSMTVGTASYITSSNIVGNIISSSYSITSSYVPNLYPVNLNGYVSTSSFNNYTSSNNSVVNSLINATASYITISQTGSMSVLNSTSASYLSGSNVIVNNLTVIGLLNGTSSVSKYSNSGSIASVSNNLNYYIDLSAGTAGNQPTYIGTGLLFNPALNLLTTTTLSSSGITSSLYGTSSYAITASYANNAGSTITSGSTYHITSSVSISSSYSNVAGSVNSLPDITDKSGNIGINQTNPQYNLDVNGHIGNSVGDLTLTGIDNIVLNSNAGISLNTSYTGNNIYLNSIYTGVNQLSPQHTLDVGGDINFTGNLINNGSPFIPPNAVSASYSTKSNVLNNFNFNTTQSYILNNTQSNFVILQYPTTSIGGAQYQYNVHSGSNHRAGYISATWYGTNCVYSDNSTNDIGNTLDVSMSVVVNGSNIQLLAAASSSLSWRVNAFATYN